MRTKVKDAVSFGSWEEVNDALRQIGENNRDIAAAENVMNEQIANAKAAAEAKCANLRANTNMLAQALETFATTHRADMGKLKSRQLTFGTVSFRLSSKIGLPTGADELEAIVKRLRMEGMADCIVQPPPKVSKDALRKYSDEKIISIGATVKTKETFGYEIDCEEIAKL